MSENEIIIKPHRFTALFIYFLKSLIFILIFLFSFKVINKIIGYDLIMYIVETMQIAFRSIIQSESYYLTHSFGLQFLEEKVVYIFLVSLLLAFAQQSNIINKYWKFTNRRFEFVEGFFSLKKTVVSLDKITRIYSVPKADFRGTGDIYIELSIKEKRLKLPFVFDAEQIIKKISNMVERYKEKVIEEDIKKDIKR